ncbi:MAG: DNA internalization-related competence protein ComEC/Rec2 [Lawsonibacter sp.]
MRKLGTFAGAFALAVAVANWLLPTDKLPIFGVICLGAAVGCRMIRLRYLRVCGQIACCGAALGLLWTAAYEDLFFQPAKELDGKTVVLAGTVSEWPQETEYGVSVLVQADTDSFVRINTLLYIDEQGRALQPGDQISTVAHCTLANRTFSGEEITYYTAKGVFLRAEGYGKLEVCRPDHIPLRYWPAMYAEWLQKGITATFSEDTAPMICALATGNREDFSDTFQIWLERAGLSHMVAVSGMHLAYLAGLVGLVLGYGKRSTSVVVCVIVTLFCMMVGNTPSVVRATVMIILLHLAPLLQRERDSFTALGLALLILLLQNPYAVSHIGLQLSFGAVAGILWVSDPIQTGLLKSFHLNCRPKSRLRRGLWRVPRFFVSIFCATLGASVFTVPLVAFHFGTFSLVAPVSNLLTLWAVSWLFGAGLILGSLGILAPQLVSVAAIPFVWLTRYLNWIIEELGQLPLAAISLDSVYYRAWVVLLCLMVGAAIWIKGEKRLILPGCALTVAFVMAAVFTTLTFRAGSLLLVTLDVGQGQSVVLRLGNYVALIDCGGDCPENAGDVAADYLQSVGKNRLDLLVVSHYHDDHANGVAQLLKRVEVSALALPDVEQDAPLRQEIVSMAQTEGIPIWYIRQDTTLRFGPASELTIYPPLGFGTDSNELGLTVLAGAGEYHALLPGDMDGQVEQQLLAHVQLPRVECLVVGHHGSATSSTMEFLSAIQPEVAILSVGANNRYGHPALETLERLDGLGTKIYRTDLQGTVEFRVKGS